MRRGEAALLASKYKNTQAQSHYKYVILPGNNSEIVKECMLLRADRWQETSSFDKLFNFKWQ